MQLTLRRPLSVSPLALFVVVVLFMDAAGVAAVLLFTLRGHIVNDWLSFYAAGTMVRTGQAAHLYDLSAQAAVQRTLMGSGVETTAYPLPAFVALLFAPLTMLSLQASYLVWFAANFVLLALLLRLSWDWLERVPQALRIVFLLSAVSLSAFDVVFFGQVELLVLAGFLGCYALLRANRPFIGPHARIGEAAPSGRRRPAPACERPAAGAGRVRCSSWRPDDRTVIPAGAACPLRSNAGCYCGLRDRDRASAKMLAI